MCEFLMVATRGVFHHGFFVKKVVALNDFISFFPLSRRLKTVAFVKRLSEGKTLSKDESQASFFEKMAKNISKNVF